MIRHLLHADIDKGWWDRQLLACTNRLWYARSDVLDIAAPRWEALVDDVSGAMMPLTWRSKYGFDYLFQPYAVQQLGVFSPLVLDTSMANLFLDAIPRRFKYVDIRLNEAMGAGPFHGGTHNTNQTLGLDAPVGMLREAYGKGHRRNLKKPLPTGSQWIELSDAEEFTRMFERTTAARFGGLKPDQRLTMLNLLRSGLEHGEARILALRLDEAIVAATCFIQWEGRSILLKSATTREGTNVGAMFHLVDRWIAGNAGVYKLLDFAGSNDPGTARFNEGFGATAGLYLNVRRNRLPVWARWMKR